MGTMFTRPLSNVLEQIAPRPVWRRRISAWNLDTEEAEAVLLAWMCDRRKISIDVGAAAGTYSARLLLFSSRVVAFEPRPSAAMELQQMFRRTRVLTVEQVALSDRTGTAVLRTPSDRPMLSTIEGENALVESNVVDSVHVTLKRLDDYRYSPVGFIKIDAEGHEAAILEGAKGTIERERPNLLVEIEERHNPGSFERVGAFLDMHNYAGYFLWRERLVDIQSFDLDANQNRGNLVGGSRIGIYINNFVFLPKERMKSVPMKYRNRGI